MSDPQTAPPLALVERFCERLQRDAVRYCHWKSNDLLERSLNGVNDLDLLVDRTHLDAFAALLGEFGFKLALPPEAERLPGVLDYYGYDRDTGTLVHLHLHYQLVVGQDRTKNYHLPLEAMLLHDTRTASGFSVPQPAHDYVVFVIRMLLKHGGWDALLAGQGRLPASARRELRFLQPQIERERLDAALRRWLPAVDPAFFARCERTLRDDAGALRRALVTRLLQRRLRACARRPMAADLWLKQSRRVWRGLRRRLGRLPRKRLAGGGTMIALVGGDGAGKSSAIADIERWLGGTFELSTVHLGRPPWSTRTRLVRGALKLARLGVRAVSRRAPPPFTLDDAPRSWHWCVARDRFLQYARARRRVGRGAIVICDRFPLRPLSLMDGPQIERLEAGRPGSRPRWRRAFYRWLAGRERRWYRSLVEPELLIVLRLPPAVAVARRSDEDSEFVRSRNEEIWRTDWRVTGARVIDAEQPQAAVQDQIRALIWSRL